MKYGSVEYLIEMQQLVLECRRMAADTSDQSEARRFHDLADQIEQGVREVDRGLCSPE